MAVTAAQTIYRKGGSDAIPFPLKNAEVVYQGALVAIAADGYAYNMDSDAAKTASIIGVAAESKTATADGTISGNVEAGANTVLVYLDGIFKLTGAGLAQADCGNTVFATDNYTFGVTESGGKKIGTLVTYLSATSGWVDLNKFYGADGSVTIKGAMTAVTGTTAGGVFNVLNPTGETILVEEVIVDVTTEATGAATIDVGVGDGATSNDALIDGLDVGTAAIIASNLTDPGTNGGIKKATSAQYITATASATLAGLVGTYMIKYRIWQ